MSLNPYAKAITGAVTGAASAYAVAIPDGVSGTELGTIIFAAVVGFCLVWAVPNTPEPVAPVKPE